MGGSKIQWGVGLHFCRAPPYLGPAEEMSTLPKPPFYLKLAYSGHK